MAERIDSKFVGIQPSDPDILTAFIYSLDKLPTNLPQGEQKLARGLQAAAEKAPFLLRFIDPVSGKLTDAAQKILQELQDKGIISTVEGAFSIPPDKKAQLSSQTRTYFTDLGIRALEEAATAANTVWQS